MGKCLGKPTQGDKLETRLTTAIEIQSSTGSKLLFHVLLSKFKVRGIELVISSIVRSLPKDQYLQQRL